MEYALLNAYAQTYEAQVKSRQALMNRMRNWLRDTLPPEQWGDADLSDKQLADDKILKLLPNNQMEYYAIVKSFEKSIQKYMQKEIKKHYLWPWLSSVRGIGENLASKLLFHLKDLNRFPTVSHLWSYCGLDGDGWKKRKHNWALTSICYLVANQFVKQGDVYRQIYEQRKAYELAKPPCPKCLEVGSLEHCTQGHSDNRARRYVAKMFLKDLWVENKRILQETKA